MPTKQKLLLVDENTNTNANTNKKDVTSIRGGKQTRGRKKTNKNKKTKRTTKKKPTKKTTRKSKQKRPNKQTNIKPEIPNIGTKTLFASVKGAREQNEDRHVISDNGLNFYWGIYDGHGGKDVSEYVSESLAHRLLQKKSPSGFTDAYIRKTHDYVQETLSQNKEVKSDYVGSTSLSMILTGDKLQIANVGDCRAVLCDGYGIAKALSMDHKPEWGPEQKRIKDLGGVITKDQGYEVYRVKNLSVSRSFGDDRHSEYIIHTPEINNVTVKPSDQFIVLGCDGLWDVMSSQDVVNFVLQKTNKTNIASSLCNHALKMGSGDNITVMVIYLYVSNK